MQRCRDTAAERYSDAIQRRMTQRCCGTGKQQCSDAATQRHENTATQRYSDAGIQRHNGTAVLPDSHTAMQRHRDTVSVTQRCICTAIKRHNGRAIQRYSGRNILTSHHTKAAGRWGNARHTVSQEISSMHLIERTSCIQGTRIAKRAATFKRELSADLARNSLGLTLGCCKSS